MRDWCACQMWPALPSIRQPGPLMRHPPSRRIPNQPPEQVRLRAAPVEPWEAQACPRRLLRTLLSLALVKMSARLIVANVPRSYADSLLSFVEFEKESRGSDQQCLDFAFVLLVHHYVEREVDDLQRLRFLSSLKSIEYLSAANIARTAHRIVGHVNALWLAFERWSVVLIDKPRQISLYVEQRRERELLRDDLENTLTRIGTALSAIEFPTFDNEFVPRKNSGALNLFRVQRLFLHSARRCSDFCRRQLRLLSGTAGGSPYCRSP